MSDSIEEQLDEIPLGTRILLQLRDGREVGGVVSKKGEGAVTLTEIEEPISVDEVEAVLLEVTSEGPE